ncbi:magnesium transporter, partial [Bacillus amyloliquefaciens]
MVKNMTYDELILRIIILLRDGKRKEFQNVLEELQPYDMAILFKEMPEKHRGRYLSFLTVEDITDLMGELDREEQLVVLNKVGKEDDIHVMNKMDNDFSLPTLFRTTSCS